MKSSIMKIFLIIALFSIMLAGCGQATPAPTEPPAPVIVEPTAVPPTAVPPTEVPPTPEPTIAPTEEPTEAPVAEATVEATPETAPVVIADSTGLVQLQSNADTNCRRYPARTAKELGYLKAGSTVNALGKNSTGDWFLIHNPTTPDKMQCWVWSGSVELLGDINSILVIADNIND